MQPSASDESRSLADVSSEAWDYLVDAAQRTILFWDIMRKRGNNYLEHLRQGQPPVLVFDHETILDGRQLNPPVNYALVRIIDRRSPAHPDRRQKAPASKGRSENRREPTSDRRHKAIVAAAAPQATSRPIVIIDPRAGHGPGIGGSKQDSQIGMALDAGHPVYFMIFFTEPMPGQSLADVRNTQIKFIEEVRRRHPKAPKPAVIGNCQGGWAAALIGAERPDLVGPMVFNGSPLSYWGGVEGANPMRYLGGLWGGVWINSLLSDLGGGKFDGANLVANFENLNPANTFWTKRYNLYANVDTEEKRYLTFEKWWGGFFLMADSEIHTIVDGLFVGNKLERGEFELEAGQRIDLKNNTNPVVVFASFGDNITPPQQAFNWIIKAYGSVDEIRRRGQVIVVHVHEKIGHLGIFVSAKIARKEHKEIIASFDMLDYLPPGLYEMRIQEDPQEPGEYIVDYVEKSTDDILAIDDGLEDELAFHGVQAVSSFNDKLYQNMIAPWVRLATTAVSAELTRQLHPLRLQRALFSDLNPWMMSVKMWAAMIKEGHGRKPAAEDNLFRRFEQYVSAEIVDLLNLYRDARDRSCERLFKAIYENPWMRRFYPPASSAIQQADVQKETLRRRDANHWRKAAKVGGFTEAAIRILLALILADREIERRGYALAGKLIRNNARLRQLSPEQLRAMVRTQARILQSDTDQAIDTLPLLVKTKKDRSQAINLLKKSLELVDSEPNAQERAVLDKITAALAP